MVVNEGVNSLRQDARFILLVDSRKKMSSEYGTLFNKAFGASN
jgi:uncharacterized protein (UPF0548 family)